MELEVFVKNEQKPLPEAMVRLDSNETFGLWEDGFPAQFADLKRGIYNIEARADSHYPRYLTIALKKSGKLVIELKERR